MGQKIQLSESQLRNLIKESVRKAILKEMEMSDLTTKKALKIFKKQKNLLEYDGFEPNGMDGGTLFLSLDAEDPKTGEQWSFRGKGSARIRGGDPELVSIDSMEFESPDGETGELPMPISLPKGF